MSSENIETASKTVAHASLVPRSTTRRFPMQGLSVHEQIREYYGRILAGSDDLKTNACCCTTDAPPKYVLDVMPDIADEIMDRFYGCGSPIPPALEGLHRGRSGLRRGSRRVHPFEAGRTDRPRHRRRHDRRPARRRPQIPR